MCDRLTMGVCRSWIASQQRYKSGIFLKMLVFNRYVMTVLRREEKDAIGAPTKRQIKLPSSKTTHWVEREAFNQSFRNRIWSWRGVSAQDLPCDEHQRLITALVVELLTVVVVAAVVVVVVVVAGVSCVRR